MLHIKQRKTGHPFFWYVVEKRTKWDILYNFFQSVVMHLSCPQTYEPFIFQNLI